MKFTIVLPEQFPDCSIIEIKANSLDNLLKEIESKTSIPKKYINLEDPTQSMKILSKEEEF